MKKGKETHYNPDIEEFHVGFEYELEVMSSSGASTEFVEFSVDNGADIDNAFIFDDWSSSVRVKYLDSLDVESFGFESSMKWLMEGGRYYLTKDYNCPRGFYQYAFVVMNERNSHTLIVIASDEHFSDSRTLFAGDIKNKSELGVVLKMVGV